MNRRKLNPTAVMAFFVVMLLVAACSPAQARQVTTAGASAQNAGDPLTPNNVVNDKISDGPVAPDWTLETLEGGTFHLAEHEGKVVVMFFMASWCSSCVLEARALAQLHEQYADQGLIVVAINVEPEKNTAALSQFRAVSNDAAYTWVFDNEYKVTKLYAVKALDSTIIIDRGGRIAYTDGFLTPFETLETEIGKWL
jgi:peroxiredoxin